MRVPVAVLSLSVALLSAPAMADVVYDFHMTGGDQQLAPFPRTPWHLDITDAAYSAGIAAITWTCTDISPTCDIMSNGVVDLYGQMSEIQAGANDHGDVFVFTLSGGILAGGLTVAGAESDYIMSGSGYAWTGVLTGSDLFMDANCSEGCAFTGYWLAATEVPEPWSVPLLLVGMMSALGLSVARRAR